MSRRSLIDEALAAPASAIEVAPAAVAPPTAPKTFTTRRLEGFTEAARMVKRPTIRLKPAECSIWPGNARDYALLSETRLRSLIDSIQAENGNRIPVVVRRTPQGACQYELVIGTRRHWAVAWLNANHYPDIELVAIIEDLDDEAAFRLADIENREREDISDLERGMNYKAAVEAYYDGVQARLADRVKLSKSMLARYIGLTDIPATVISAFNSPMDLQVRHGDKLLPVLRNPALRSRVEEAARQIAAEQSFRQSGDEEPIGGAEVVARLVKAATTRPARSQKATIDVEGRCIGTVERDRARGLTLTLNPTDLAPDDILAALRPVIERARIFKGNGR
ncbi:ParB/RepB/Spo0J family partition protein [Novosphingobium cyanobacteriorum]|uniref:ParB/RepB/Spo0J family partition protein n=1 Tax=Novosphingobium cyanobacteriorum TaxID=3024215 RepID=A0ABT6CIB8_9SPHN|nr:ParB/RepB/Spo0J family partition protein [Novosphingobium cyanobacteriorum]MDF8333666.1 ParB/RepB/Spo0J family partition protein [Novosphingobium cyanobacteriorum]